MAATLPNGATLSLATTYGAVKVMTAVSNANPAIASLASGHSIVAGDFMEVTSGWGRLNGRAVKAGTPSSDDIPLLGINATDTTKYPALGGAGSIREITAFTQITQILGFTTTGGDPKYTTFEFLEEDFERQLAAGTSAQSLEIQIADDDSLAGYLALQAASDDGLLRVLKMTLKDASVILYNGFVHLNETPTVNKSEVMAVKATMALQGRPVRY